MVKTINVAFDNLEIQKFEKEEKTSWHDFIVEQNKRIKELESFSSDVKRIAHGTGRSRNIDVSQLEELFIKYNIKIQ